MRTGEHQGRAREHRIAATGDASSASVGRRRNRSGLTSEPAGNKYCRVRRNRPPSPASGAPPGAALIRGPSDSAVGAWKICSRSEATCRSRSSSVVALYAAFGFASAGKSARGARRRVGVAPVRSSLFTQRSVFRPWCCSVPSSCARLPSSAARSSRSSSSAARSAARSSSSAKRQPAKREAAARSAGPAVLRRRCLTSRAIIPGGRRVPRPRRYSAADARPGRAGAN